MTVFLKFSGRTFALSQEQNLEKQLSQLFQKLNIKQNDLNLQCNGRILNKLQNIKTYSTIHVTIPLVGGKGGYGAKLKNQGGKKVRPNDNRFSRDAQGRRIEYQMAQKQYTQFIKKKMQQDQKVNEQREKFKAMQETMKQGNSFMKMDRKYNEQVQVVQSKLAESIRIGREKLAEKMRLQKQFQNQKEKVQAQADDENQQPESNGKRQRSSNSQTVQKQQDKDEKQIQAIQKPTKKVKVDEAFVDPIKFKEKQAEKPTFTSAKDKLKSLFRK